MGIKVGDRITKIGPGAVAMGPLAPFQGRDNLMSILAQLEPGRDVRVEVVRKEGGKTETLTVKLGDSPDSVPDKLPEADSKKKALEPKKPLPGAPPMPPMGGEKKEEPKKDKKPQTGLIKRTNENKDKNYWIYVPEDYNPRSPMPWSFGCIPSARARTRILTTLRKAGKTIVPATTSSSPARKPRMRPAG